MKNQLGNRIAGLHTFVSNPAGPVPEVVGPGW